MDYRAGLTVCKYSLFSRLISLLNRLSMGLCGALRDLIRLRLRRRCFFLDIVLCAQPRSLPVKGGLVLFVWKPEGVAHRASGGSPYKQSLPDTTGARGVRRIKHRHVARVSAVPGTALSRSALSQPAMMRSWKRVPFLSANGDPKLFRFPVMQTSYPTTI